MSQSLLEQGQDIKMRFLIFLIVITPTTILGATKRREHHFRGVLPLIIEGGNVMNAKQAQVKNRPDCLAACKMIISTADSAAETGHTEAEVIAGNWDVLAPIIRAAINSVK